MMKNTKSKYLNLMPVRIRGFTLIELMISITLGLVLVAGVAYTYLGNRVTYRQQDSLARMQEGARYAFEALDFDIRMAGFTGCTETTSANVLNTTTAVDGDLFTQPLTGYQEGASTFPTTMAASRLRGDAITVLRANTDNEYIVASHNPASAQLQLTANHDLKQGEILVITDCQHASTFQMTNVNNNNTIATVNHNDGTATSPGNCTKGFGLTMTGVPDCGSANGVAYTYPAGSRIFRLSGNTYFIGTNAAGQPALFRQRLTQSGGNVATTAEELVEGVENMQILYGVDQSATADNVVDVYLTADNVTQAATPGATNAEKWRRVLSVKIELLMRSTENNITTAEQAYTFNGSTNPTPGDRRLRKVFTSTIAIRNRL